jgi:hypothetical protein
MFDIAVNGGEFLTIYYEKEQYLKSQRQVNVPWQDYIWAPDVVLIQPDSKSNTVSLTNNSQMQVASGSTIVDRDGTRKATILFPSGIQVTNFNADNIVVRTTEYTVGENGPQRMPASLPPQSGYTYCVELSVDGAEDVRFNKPVHFYVENFLDFPVGGIVPTGYYDKNKAVWIPSENGRIIKILTINNNTAVLDVNGNGLPADSQSLANLGIDNEELQKLASLYSAGSSLWRVPVTHFSTWDCNWPYGPPPGAVPPKLPDIKTDDKLDKPCYGRGSIIEIQKPPIQLEYRLQVIHFHPH